MIERPYFLKSLANTTWSELNWRHDWGVGKIIGNHTDMVAFKAVGKVEVAYESVVVFEMMSNDGMLVSLNGAILKPNMWFPHERMREEHRVLLHVGLHDVEVLWFEKDGEAFSEFKMYPIGWSVEETIHLSRGEIRADPEYGSCYKYNATWESNFLLGQNYQFNWILEDEKGNFFDEKTTYVHLYVPIDGDFTINGVVVQNATFKVSKPNIEFWFYSKSRGDEVSSVIIEVSDDNGLLPDPNGRILLTEIEQDKVWYGSCTLQRDGEFSLMGYFHTVREEEWVKMSVDLQYKTELSSVQIRFLINGITIVLILVLGYSIFYLGRWLTKYEQIKS
jgi:hypothetical protein